MFYSLNSGFVNKKRNEEDVGWEHSQEEVYQTEWKIKCSC